MMWIEILTTVICGVFSGAAIYINLAEHPARLSCGTELAATEFPPSYKRATRMQALLVIIGTVLAFVTWMQTGDSLWLIGAILFGAIFPYTLIVIMPTNKQLIAPDIDRSAESTRALLVRWGYLHMVRSVLALIAFVVFTYALAT